MKTVILAAGFGSRLWPLSTPDRPKQFQTLLSDEESLLQYTYGQFLNVSDKQDLFVLTLAGFEPIVKEQLPGISDDNIISVPERRNTLPHTLFALKQLSSSPDEQLLFTTVDHYLTDPEQFLSTLNSALSSPVARADDIYVVCTENTGYDPNAGYAAVAENGHVTEYREKPTEEELAAMAASGRVLKDTAIFTASISSILNAATSLDGELQNQISNFLNASDGQRVEVYLNFEFMDIPTKLFEHARNLSLIQVDCEFIDIGRYSSLRQILPKDEKGNVVMGDVVMSEECRGNLIINKTDAPLVVVGQQNSVIVHTADGHVHAPFDSVDQVGAVYKSQIFHRTKKA
jgi:mannose-1-phosphate guanylyltransferase